MCEVAGQSSISFPMEVVSASEAWPLLPERAHLRVMIAAKLCSLGSTRETWSSTRTGG